MRTNHTYSARHFEEAALPHDVVEELALQADAGKWEQLEKRARALTGSHPGEAAGWRALGLAFFQQGKWSAALDALAELARLAPEDARAHHDLGYVFYKLGREQEAEGCYHWALKCDPFFVPAHNNLGALLADLGRIAEAAAHFQKALTIDPESSFALFCLGSLMDRVGGMESAAKTFLERSLAINPHDANALNTIGNLLLRTGEAGRALEMFRRAQTLSPLVTWRARKEVADFSVLLLYAPGSGCTPLDHLLRKASYDCHFYCVLPEAPPDLDLLRSKGDVVVNMIGDADSDREILPCARELVERLGRPTLNDPSFIAGTDREAVARRLSGIPFCRVPKTMRLSGAALAEAAGKGGVAGFAPPLLVRVAGKHGGDQFERLADWQAVAAFVADCRGEDYYLTEYLEYRSNDGWYRKYRFICIDGKLFPYHLAIHDDWKVHHFRTDMANRAWMRAEEERFLDDPAAVFGGRPLAALQAVAAGSGLDYCGIDCAIDGNGELVVFETNATMVVHDEKEGPFAYKNRYVATIKEAFDRMLARRAGH